MNAYSPADATTRNGFSYDATSQMWKDFCAVLPCSAVMAWPGYHQATFFTTIAGQPAVIQCWKGWCEDAVEDLDLGAPYGTVSFPGGFGAEVGVYRLKPDLGLGGIPKFDLGLPSGAQALVDDWVRLRVSGAGNPVATTFWWPADDLVKATKKPVSFTLSDPVFGDVLISKYSTKTYWTCKWMRLTSYAKWCIAWQARHLRFSLGGIHLTPQPQIWDFVLDFTIDGKNYRWVDNSGIHEVA